MLKYFFACLSLFDDSYFMPLSTALHVDMIMECRLPLNTYLNDKKVICNMLILNKRRKKGGGVTKLCGVILEKEGI